MTLRQRLHERRLRYAWQEQGDGSWITTVGPVRMVVFKLPEGWHCDVFMNGDRVSPERRVKYANTPDEAMRWAAGLAASYLRSLAYLIDEWVGRQPAKIARLGAEPVKAS